MAQDIDVLLVLVATNGASWLPDTIASIKSQTHEHLTVVAVDNASKDSSRALLQKAFGKESVVSLERRAGYARALVAAMKAAGDRAKNAGAFLLLHDDCAMEPGTVAALLDSLSYEGVEIAGPKLAEWDDPEVLQEAGLSIDRYARIFDPLERGELDQGQYDQVKEVLWVSSACMLITRSLVERIGFFDARFVLFREDLDFCWRARIAGAKVAFCGTTKARHAAASLRNLRDGWATGRVRYFVERNMLASMIQNYSRATLVLVLPVAVLFALGSALLYLATGRRSAAGQILEAVRWNAVHVAGTIRARARAQRVRTVADSEVTKLAMRGAHRVRSLAERIFERVAGEPAEGL
ncbi:MAG TPA: glycosyltransferase family 2 protein, partial [Burkholderiales bacterium]|nr:glycosyltransferase family 2 protein [Burkholderiales bacterium]